MKKIFIATYILISTNAIAGIELFNQADSLYTKGEFQESILTYNKILENGLESPEIYYNLAICHLEIKDYKNSKRNIEKSISLNQNLKKSQELLEFCHKKLNHSDPPIIFYKNYKNKILKLFIVSNWIIISLVMMISLFILIFMRIFISKNINYMLIIILMICNIITHQICKIKISEQNITLSEKKSK